MAIVVIGLNHRTAPLSCWSGSRSAARGARRRCTTCACGRTSPRWSCCRPATGPRSTPPPSASTAPTATSGTSSARSPGWRPEELALHLVSQYDEEAATHLFEVAAGLRSAVLGESEILGQVRDAWMLAQREGTTRASLNLLFRRAVEVGKRARSETGIGRGTASVSQAAVEMAEERLGSLSRAKVVVVGAGEVGEGGGRRAGGAWRRRDRGGQPRCRPGLGPGRAGRRAGRADRPSWTRRWPRPTSSSPAPGPRCPSSTTS